MKVTPSMLLARAAAAAALVAALQTASAQTTRIPHPADDTRRFTVRGNLHPLAQARFDQGRATASLRLDRLTIVLKPNDARAAQLDAYLAELQDPKSPNYHRWLTPESYADRFGLSGAEIGRIVEWLSAQGLTVTGVARARNAIMASGAADRVERAFQTEIHTYLVHGESHYANATEPSLPSELEGAVVAIRGLHDFRLRPRHRMLATPAPAPRYTFASDGNHYLAPDDFATIFNIKPLYNAGVDGSDQNIVIVGQSRIEPSHLSKFRSYFGLPDAQLTATLVPGTRDPGVRQRDEQESDLDLEWASAVARSARLQFVYSYDVTDAVQYAIDENLALVISMSYGACETEYTRSDALALQEWARQGNAQGITWIASSGDSGAASCYQAATGPLGAAFDLRAVVDMPAAIPEITAIGGTTFNENGGSYWTETNGPSGASALSYIPETSWNDSATDSPASSGGGASQIFGKPVWQTGLGVPSDDNRYVPDLAFPASAKHDGYIVYTVSGGVEGWYAFGGTSAGAPAFAGILSLLNQYVVANGWQDSPGLGNVNPRVYALAASAPSAFHDVSTGDNIVTGVVCGGFLCSAPTKKSVGYTAGTGYDLVTGLGSLDVFAFFSAWKN